MILQFTRQLLAQNPNTLLNSEYRFVGTLLVGSRAAWFSFEGSEDGSLEIVDASLGDRLADVPIYVGGRYLLNDSVEFIGRLENRAGALVVASVVSGTLFRPAEDDDDEDRDYRF